MNRMKSLAKGIWRFMSYLLWPQLHHRDERLVRCYDLLQFLLITMRYGTGYRPKH